MQGLGLGLRPFQKRFLTAALSADVDTSALCLPRANGKSTLAGHLCARILDPADKLFRPGTESVLCAASLEQARIVFRFARAELEERGGYRFNDSYQRISALHAGTNTRLRVIGSNGRMAMGLVNCPWAICDEPGAWEANGGQLLHDAITTAQGKPGSPLRVLYIGTLAPSRSGWWHDLVDAGSRPGRHVTLLQGDPGRWDQWPEIRRCNPLAAISPEFRKVLLRERDEARADTRLKARFMSYRLNRPTADESETLLTVQDWQAVLQRPVAERRGQPIVGYDLGAGRAWSAAAAIWQTGRLEALAVAPGIPSLAEQERRDRVDAGTYTRLAETGRLIVADGLRVQPPAMLHDAALAAWGTPANIVADRFRVAELRDALRGSVPLIERVTRWSEASEDIRALRRLAKDGPLSCDPDSGLLVAASLAAAMVKNDDQGSVRLVKRGANNEARDDVAAALLLAAGSWQRAMRKGVAVPRQRIAGLIG